MHDTMPLSQGRATSIFYGSLWIPDCFGVRRQNGVAIHSGYTKVVSGCRM